MVGSLWVLADSGKEAVVVDINQAQIGFVYDRVDQPDGPTSQYGVQWMPWADFCRAHDLKEWKLSPASR